MNININIPAATRGFVPIAGIGSGIAALGVAASDDDSSVPARIGMGAVGIGGTAAGMMAMGNVANTTRMGSALLGMGLASAGAIALLVNTGD